MMAGVWSAADDYRAYKGRIQSEKSISLLSGGLGCVTPLERCDIYTLDKSDTLFALPDSLISKVDNQTNQCSFIEEPFHPIT